MFIIACIISFVPSVALFLWLRNSVKKEEDYKKLIGRALLQGALSVFPVVLFSALFSLLVGLTGIKKTSPLLYAAMYNFIVLAFAEELVKYRTGRGVLKKRIVRLLPVGAIPGH
ncbi:MAG: hypothetical protein J6N77_04155 [Lachnospiraceae bacterium]|nr:hypothetical protein [Lachnospiraceae bacterium]